LLITTGKHQKRDFQKVRDPWCQTETSLKEVEGRSVGTFGLSFYRPKAQEGKTLVLGCSKTICSKESVVKQVLRVERVSCDSHSANQKRPEQIKLLEYCHS